MVRSLLTTVDLPEGISAAKLSPVDAPPCLQHPRFRAVPLRHDNAAADYAAYMASPDVIRVHSDGRWPVEGFTFADNLTLVRRHMDDHEQGLSFTFTLMDPTEVESLGCLYVNPLRDFLERVNAPTDFVSQFTNRSAMVTFWLRQDQQDTDLAEVVVGTVHRWLSQEWQLDRHAFRNLPGEESSLRALMGSGMGRFGVPSFERPAVLPMVLVTAR